MAIINKFLENFKFYNTHLLDKYNEETFS